MPAPRRTGTVAQTSVQAIATALVLGVGFGWSAFTAIDRFGDVPTIPVLVAGAIAVLAAAVGTQAWFTHRTIQVQRRLMPPRRAVGLLVLGKTCLLSGAVLAGAYAAITVFLALRLGLNMPANRLAGPVAAFAASAALAVAGAFLERACRVPDPPDDGATPTSLPGTQDSAD